MNNAQTLTQGQKQQEVWKDIVGWEGSYEVSNFGRVYSHKREDGRVLKPKVDKDGYCSVVLWHTEEKKMYYYRSHRLEALAFLPNPNNLPVVHHLDNDKQNNDLNNLEWTTVAHNTHEGVRENKQGNFITLTDDDFEFSALLYEEGMSYEGLNKYFGINALRTEWSDIMKARRYSSLTGLTHDVRRSVCHSCNIITDIQAREILSKYHLKGVRQIELCSEYQLSAAQISRIVNGSRKKKVYTSFMEEING